MDQLRAGHAHGIITAEDLLARMRAGTKAVYEIKIRELTIPVRVLTADEINTIRRDAKLQSTVKNGDSVDENLERQKVALKVASTLPGGGPLISDKLLSLMSVDEIGFIYEEYVRIMDAVNPSVQTIDPEVFRALVDALKKKRISSKDLSLHQLRAICTAYVDEMWKQENQELQTVNSRGGLLVE